MSQHEKEFHVKQAYYASPFVPPALLAAHGFEPVDASSLALPSENQRLVGHLQGVCPFAAFVHDVARRMAKKEDVIVFAGTCDQMRRIADFLVDGTDAAIFVLNIPAACETSGVEDYYADELKRLGRFLVAHGGHLPTMDVFRNANKHDRKCLKASREGRGGRKAKRIAIVGGPASHRLLAEMGETIRRHGGEIALDATENGMRCAPVFPKDDVGSVDDAYAFLAKSYFKIPDVFRRPDTLLHEWLRRELRATKAQGLILVRCLWCDLWRLAGKRIIGDAGISCVEIELDDFTQGLSSRSTLRIQSLLEAL